MILMFISGLLVGTSAGMLITIFWGDAFEDKLRAGIDRVRGRKRPPMWFVPVPSDRPGSPRPLPPPPQPGLRPIVGQRGSGRHAAPVQRTARFVARVRRHRVD